MKKIYILLILASFLLKTSASYAQYTITQLTDNTYTDTNPQINDDGYVVWTGDSAIFLNNGSTTTKISDDNYSNLYPQINDNGYVVWWGVNDSNESNIFLYDGYSTSIISNSTFENDNPQINDNGYVVWSGKTSTTDRDDIFLYDGSTVTNLTNSPLWGDYNPQISANGNVVWMNQEFGEIFLYDGKMIKQISLGNTSNTGQQINDIGQVVWWGQAPDGWGYHEIFFYDGSTTRNITETMFAHETMPQINNRGQIVFSRQPYGGSNDIYLYDGLTIREISNNPSWDGAPQINDSGIIVYDPFGGYIGEGNDWDIFLYDGASTINLSSNNPFDDRAPQINSKGDVVWWGYDGADVEIFLATKIVPEPISSTLFLIGAGMLAGRRYFRRK